MFPGIVALPEPATGSHVVNHSRGTPVAPCRLKAQTRRERVTRVGSPSVQPSFPKYHASEPELFQVTRKSPTGITAEPENSLTVCVEPAG